MTHTYRAVQVASPGQLELVERPVRDPGPAQVRLRVEACGVCHSDSATVNVLLPSISLPRVPGHEVVGRVDAVGPGVHDRHLGERVGVGWFGANDGTCEPCRRGDVINCVNLMTPGISFDGGYAEIMLVDANALVTIPTELSSAEATPLLDAGLTTFNALRNAHARPGDHVAVLGVGGLGHLAIQYARKMGFRTTAIARGRDKEALALQLGAHHYIDSEAGDPAGALQALGGAAVILATAASGQAMTALIGGLAVRGRMVVVGVPPDPITIAPVQLVFGHRAIEGSLTGSPIDIQETLAFSVLQDIRPMIETLPLEQAAEAYARMMRNEARFRLVLTMG
jgi:D-arabinose 1-dehydrogenase-like Zn-dependent alcohol dehydrogenase